MLLQSEERKQFPFLVTAVVFITWVYFVLMCHMRFVVAQVVGIAPVQRSASPACAMLKAVHEEMCLQVIRPVVCLNFSRR